jgi:hypothetical protein
MLKAKTNLKKPMSKAKIATISAASVAILGGGTVLYGVTQEHYQEMPSEPTYTISTTDYAAAQNNLSALNTRANDYQPPTDYDSKSMPDWNDADKNGCKSRDDILARDLENEKFKTEDKCKIVYGELFDYYIGETILFDANISGGGIDIDHIVAKGDAWNSGGYNWTSAKWTEFANDPEELIAVSASINRQKGDKNAAEWLPPNELFYCRYVIYQVNIKFKYQLSITKD